MLAGCEQGPPQIVWQQGNSGYSRPIHLLSTTDPIAANQLLASLRRLWVTGAFTSHPRCGPITWKGWELQWVLHPTIILNVMNKWHVPKRRKIQWEGAWFLPWAKYSQNFLCHSATHFPPFWCMLRYLLPIIHRAFHNLPPALYLRPIIGLDEVNWYGNIHTTPLNRWQNTTNDS